MKDTTPTKVELLQHIQELQDMLAEAQRGAEPVEPYTPEYLYKVAVNTLLPTDFNKRMALTDLIHALERADGWTKDAAPQRTAQVQTPQRAEQEQSEGEAIRAAEEDIERFAEGSVPDAAQSDTPTPRTDVQACRAGEYMNDSLVVPAEFADQLERECAELRAALEAERKALKLNSEELREWANRATAAEARVRELENKHD